MDCQTKKWQQYALGLTYFLPFNHQGVTVAPLGLAFQYGIVFIPGQFLCFRQSSTQAAFASKFKTIIPYEFSVVGTNFATSCPLCHQLWQR